MKSQQHANYEESPRGNIISEFFVLAAVTPVENDVKDLSRYIIKEVDTAWLKKYVDLKCAYVWGVKYNEEGLLKLVELTTPIQQDLDGYGVVHKSHKIFKRLTDGQNSIQFAKEQLQDRIDAAYTSVKLVNNTSQAMLAMG